MSDQRQRDQIVYAFICGYLVEHGYSPTLMAIMEGCNIGYMRYVSDSLNRLENAGLIWREAGKTHNIRVYDERFNLVAIQPEKPDPEIVLLQDILRGLHRLKSSREKEG